MLRCCHPAGAGEFAPCYASVLVAGQGLETAVSDLEQEAVVCPCVTAWCKSCKRSALCVEDRSLFPCPSAHLAHSIAVHRMVEGTLSLTDPVE